MIEKRSRSQTTRGPGERRARDLRRKAAGRLRARATAIPPTTKKMHCDFVGGLARGFAAAHQDNRVRALASSSSHCGPPRSIADAPLARRWHRPAASCRVATAPRPQADTHSQPKDARPLLTSTLEPPMKPLLAATPHSLQTLTNGTLHAQARLQMRDKRERPGLAQHAPDLATSFGCHRQIGIECDGTLTRQAGSRKRTNTADSEASQSGTHPVSAQPQASLRAANQYPAHTDRAPPWPAGLGAFLPRPSGSTLKIDQTLCAGSNPRRHLSGVVTVRADTDMSHEPLIAAENSGDYFGRTREQRHHAGAGACCAYNGRRQLGMRREVHVAMGGDGAGDTDPSLPGTAAGRSMRAEGRRIDTEPAAAAAVRVELQRRLTVGPHNLGFVEDLTRDAARERKSKMSADAASGLPQYPMVSWRHCHRNRSTPHIAHVHGRAESEFSSGSVRRDALDT